MADTRIIDGDASHIILDNAIEGIVIADLDTKKLRYVNRAFAEMFGYSVEEMLCLGVSAIHPPDQLEEVIKTFEAQARGEFSLAMELPCLRKDGTTFWADVNTSKIMISGEYRNVGFFSDVTERKNTREQIAASQRLLASIFDAVPDLLTVVDRDLKIQYTNAKGIEQIRQSDPDKAKTCYGRFKLLNAPCENCCALTAFETGTTTEMVDQNPVDGRTREIRVFPIRDAQGGVPYVVEHVRDITDQIQAQEDRIQLEHQLQQKQRIESLGILAGGIAHDFNNLLGGIYGFLDLARDQSTNPEVISYLNSSLSTMNRARDLTRQLLTFAKGGAPNLRIGSLVNFVRETTEFALSGSNVSCSFDIFEDLWTCNFDVNQMSQVIDNIVINASQAMPMGGELRVTAENLHLRENAVTSLPAGPYVCLAFKDSGIGIPAEIIERLFDPFFTTKQKGSGLGLAISYSVVRKHDGCIEVESKPGRGSIFKIYLPATNGSPEIEERVREELPKASCASRVIVMDDEEVVRKSIGYMLKYCGYTPVLAKDGQEVLAIMEESREKGQEIAAIILDLTVPGGMGGKQTVEEIRKTDQLIPVFVSSGYADDPIIQNPEHFGFTDSITKPFLRADLTDLINRNLKKS